MIIEPGRIMNDFIEPNKNQYAIPVYQRNYEWSSEQCIKLFEDIVNAYKKDKTHFCGSVVRAPLSEHGGIHQYIVIDGQQRLTTIYLLLKAMMDCSDKDSEKELIQEALYNVDKFDEYTIDTASKLKLKPIKSDNQQLLLLMDNKLDEVNQATGIWKNYSLFRDLVEAEIKDGLSIKEIYKGLEKLIIAKISLQQEDNPQEIFERINSTGIPLSLSDKIRNFVLMTDKNQEILYETYWLRVENLVQKDQMTSFFLDYLNMKVDGFLKEDNAYDGFKKVFKEGNYTNESILKEILHYAIFYHTFMFGSKNYSNEVNSLLKGLRKLNQTTVYLFLYRVFDDYEIGILSGKELEKVLTFLLNYSIRRLVCDIGSNSLRGLYKTLYSRIFTNTQNKDHYYDSIVSFFMQLSSKDALPSDNDFLYALKYSNLYRKNALCKYMLTAIENQGKDEIVVGNLTIEHIMPQTKNLSPLWKDMLGDNWAEVQEKYLHTLGNLTLTAYNSELGDKPFDKKKELLDEVNSKVVKLYSFVKKCNVWNEKKIEERAELLSKELFNLFPIESPSNIISFEDPRYKEYSCDNPDDATYKVISYYVLQGERIKTTSFAVMLRDLINRLYQIDKKPIEEMARNNETILSWSQNIMFSYEKNNVSGAGYLVSDSDIYQSSGFSASHIMCIICALLDKYEIEHSEFSYSARDNKQNQEQGGCK